MLSEREVWEIFKRELPGVDVVNVPRMSYVEASMKHVFIQQQIRLGIYNEDNIYTEFLSYARSYVPLNRVEYCYELLQLHAWSVPDAIVRAYVAHVAHHEAEHFRTTNRPGTWQEHALAELECTHSTDNSAEDAFSKASPVVQRVYARIAKIERSIQR